MALSPIPSVINDKNVAFNLDELTLTQFITSDQVFWENMEHKTRMTT